MAHTKAEITRAALHRFINRHGAITNVNVPEAARAIVAALDAGPVGDQCKGQCWFCGALFGKKGAKKTREHLTPRCRGGDSSKSNVVNACETCNGEKGRLTLDEYRAVISHRAGGKPVTFWGEDPANRHAPNSTYSLGEALEHSGVLGFGEIQ